MLGLDNAHPTSRCLLIILLLVVGAKRLPEMGTSLGSGLRGFKESLSGEEPSHVDISHTESSPAAVADTPALTPAPQPVVAAVSSEASEARTPQTVGAAR